MFPAPIGTLKYLIRYRRSRPWRAGCRGGIVVACGVIWPHRRESTEREKAAIWQKRIMINDALCSGTTYAPTYSDLQPASLSSRSLHKHRSALPDVSSVDPLRECDFPEPLSYKMRMADCTDTVYRDFSPRYSM